MLAWWLWQWAAVFSYDVHRGSEKLGEAMPHHGDGRYDRNTELPAQRLGIDMQPFLTCLIHHVQGQHDRPPELAQLQSQLKVALKGGGVRHLDNHVGRSKRCWWFFAFMA